MNRSAALTLEVHAVGFDVPSAMRALADGLGWGILTDLTWDVGQDLHHRIEQEWDARFTVAGKTHKAAGQFVRGGVIVTWWRQDPFQD